jgi:hypothetical protein
VLGQEATILVYSRPDGVVETEAIIIRTTDMRTGVIEKWTTPDRYQQP